MTTRAGSEGATESDTFALYVPVGEGETECRYLFNSQVPYALLADRILDALSYGNDRVEVVVEGDPQATA